MAAAGAVHDPSVRGRVGFLEKVIEQVDGIIQVIVVRFANGDVDLTSKLWTDGLPILLEQHPQVVFFPVIDDRLVDDAGLWVPKRNGTAIGAARAIRRVP